MYFPSTILNSRVKIQIKQFFDDMNVFFKARGWPESDYKLLESGGKSKDFIVNVSGRYDDGSVNVIEFIAFVPSFGNWSGRRTKNKHVLEIEIPRSYPADLSKIRIRCITSISHPRFGKGISGRACIIINGELDRILVDLVFQLLYEPGRVQPPSMYNSDHGLNHLAMTTYINLGPDLIYENLLIEWNNMRTKT